MGVKHSPVSPALAVRQLAGVESIVSTINLVVARVTGHGLYQDRQLSLVVPCGHHVE